MDALRLTILEGCHCVMLTFGGKQVWVQQQDEPFVYSFVVAQCDGYTVVQSGLNYYVFDTARIRMEPADGRPR